MLHITVDLRLHRMTNINKIWARFIKFGYKSHSQEHAKLLHLFNSVTRIFAYFVYLMKLVGGCFEFNGPSRQYFSVYSAVPKREGERGKKR